MRDGQTTTSEDRATQLLICEALSLATRPCTTVRYSDVHVCIVWEGTFYCPEISKTSTVYVQKYSVCGLV